MNIKIRLFAVLLAVLCTVLVSCTEENEPSKNGEGQQAQQETLVGDDGKGGEKVYGTVDESVNAKKALEIMSVLPEYPEGYPTLEDVALMYKKANMAVGWIISTEKVAVFEDDTLSANGLQYKRVRPDCFYGADNLEKYGDKFDDTQKRIFNMECLEAYLRTLMSPQEAEAYIEDARDMLKFTEDENGNLYVLPFHYTPEGFGEEVYTLEDNQDGTYTFNVAYTLLDEDGNVYKEKNASFKFIQMDGRWVFERFRVLRQN